MSLKLKLRIVFWNMIFCIDVYPKFSYNYKLKNKFWDKLFQISCRNNEITTIFIVIICIIYEEIIISQQLLYAWFGIKKSDESIVRNYNNNITTFGILFIIMYLKGWVWLCQDRWAIKSYVPIISYTCLVSKVMQS